MGGGERDRKGGEGEGGNGAVGGGGVKGPSISREDQLPRELSRVLSKVKEFSTLTTGETTSSIKPLV